MPLDEGYPRASFVRAKAGAGGIFLAWRKRGVLLPTSTDGAAKCNSYEGALSLKRMKNPSRFDL